MSLSIRAVCCSVALSTCMFPFAASAQPTEPGPLDSQLSLFKQIADKDVVPHGTVTMRAAAGSGADKYQLTFTNGDKQAWNCSAVVFTQGQAAEYISVLLRSQATQKSLAEKAVSQLEALPFTSTNPASWTPQQHTEVRDVLTNFYLGNRQVAELVENLRQLRSAALVEVPLNSGEVYAAPGETKMVGSNSEGAIVRDLTYSGAAEATFVCDINPTGGGGFRLADVGYAATVPVSTATGKVASGGLFSSSSGSLTGSLSS